VGVSMGVGVGVCSIAYCVCGCVGVGVGSIAYCVCVCVEPPALPNEAALRGVRSRVGG